MPFNPQDLTVVFITYNRSDLLATSLQAIRASKKLAGVKVLCSDDFSKPEHLAKIERMGFDRVVAAQRNGGLGRNNNKGLKACDSKYVLMVQDDCKMVNDQAVLDAMKVMEADPSIGMVRLTGDASIFPLIKRQAQGVNYWVADHTSPAYEQLKQGPGRRRVYSDQPHVRRRELHTQVVGFYAEGQPMEATERDYEDRLDAQSQLYVAFLSPKVSAHFVHLGEHASFRTSTMKQRMDRFLLTFVNKLGIRDTGFYTTVRSAYRAFQTGLEKLGVMR
jgi:glycosyltransferase involved in cell wall biosynthesis